MNSVAGVDLSFAATGICRLRRGERVEVRTLTSPKLGRGADEFAKRDRMRLVADDVAVATLDCELLCIEGMSLNSAGASSKDLVGLWYLTLDLLVLMRGRGRPHGIVIAAPGALKRWTTGKGTATKTAVVQAITRRWNVTLANDNEADALALASIGAQHLGLLDDHPSLVAPWTPTQIQREVHDALAWPQAVAP